LGTNQKKVANNLKEAATKTQFVEVILQQSFKISKFDFDPQGDSDFTIWGDELKRGGRIYIQPNAQWKRFGLKIYSLYENNLWIAMNGNNSEWAIGYHGPIHLANGKETGNPGTILKYENDNTYTPLTVPVPSGIYLARDVEKCYFLVELNNKKYHVALQCRIHPEHAFVPNSNEELIVVDSPVYVRPCGILLKEVF